MARGEKVYYAHKGVERVFMEDRVPVGKWFDGQIKRSTDEVVWISPSLVSRWLGYLNAKEKWSRDHLQQRWEAMSSRLDGRLTFIATLYALPKQEILELTEGAPTKPETALRTRFLVTFLSQKGEHQETPVGQKKKQAPLALFQPEVSPYAVFKAYSLDSVEKWPWYGLSNLFEPLAPEFESDPPTAYDGVVGDYIRAIYLVQTPVPEEPLPSERLEVRIFAPGKQPVARFDLQVKGK